MHSVKVSIQPNVKPKEFDTQAAMHEHSLGRPGKKLHEVTLPVDFDALRFADVDIRLEWDA